MEHDQITIRRRYSGSGAQWAGGCELSRAGGSQRTPLGKNDYIGGATTSQKVFPDYEARLSRYSYLVSLFPEKIIRDLGLNLELRRRATGSFTPYAKNGRHDGLLLSNVDKEVGRKSMIDLTGSDTEFEQLKKFYNLSRVSPSIAGTACWNPWLRKKSFAAGLMSMIFPGKRGAVWRKNPSDLRSSVICKMICVRGLATDRREGRALYASA